MVKITRKRFDISQKLYCLKPILFDSREFLPGNLFKVDKDNKKQVTRARQLYQMRKIGYKEEVPDYVKKAKGEGSSGTSRKKQTEKPLEDKGVSDDMDI